MYVIGLVVDKMKSDKINWIGNNKILFFPMLKDVQEFGKANLEILNNILNDGDHYVVIPVPTDAKMEMWQKGVDVGIPNDNFPFFINQLKDFKHYTLDEIIALPEEEEGKDYSLEEKS